MEEIIRKDLLSVLRKTLEIIKQPKPDPYELRNISNHTIHNASIFQDEYSLSIAIITYALSKINERMRGRINFSAIRNDLKNAISCLEKEKKENYSKAISAILSDIAKLDQQFKMYVQEVIHQASIRKATAIYEHGVSASKTAELLGISLWELSDYLGATNVYEKDTDITSVRQRLQYTRSLFS